MKRFKSLINAKENIFVHKLNISIYLYIHCTFSTFLLSNKNKEVNMLTSHELELELKQREILEVAIITFHNYQHYYNYFETT